MKQPNHPVLDYRRPGTGQAVSLERLAAIMERREAGLLTLIVLKFTGGFLISLVGPALIASILTGIAWRVGIPGMPDWMTIFLLGCIVLIPWLCWFEWRTRGQFFLDFSRSYNTADTSGGFVRASSRGEWEMQTTLATWAAYLEIMLFGPRLMIEAAVQYRARAILGTVNRMRAAAILWQLFLRTDGLSVRELAEPDEPPQDLRRTLAYLQLLEYIDVSKKGDRAWMLTSGRRRLQRATGNRATDGK